MSVEKFFELIKCSTFHEVQLRDVDTDDELAQFWDSVPSKYAIEVVKIIDADWNARIYILWI